MNWQPGASRPLTEEQVGQWRGRIERKDRVAAEFYPQMERALKRYAKAKVAQQQTDVNALLDFRHVESKKAQLFHRTPDVQLRPIDPLDKSIPYDTLLPLRQKYLNHKLGPKEANAKAELHKTLLDAIAASGWMILEVGYENRLAEVETEQPQMFDPLAPPQKVKVKVPIWERCFISRVSPKKLGIPDDFCDTNFDASPWLSVKGTIPKSRAVALGWQIPKDFTGTVTKDSAKFDHGVASGDPADPLLEYEKIWYRAADFDAEILNPELFRCLILVAGLDTPALHVDSPYQSVDQTGRLTDDSLIGNPIHVGTLRDLTDSAYVPSDLVVGEQLSVEVNHFRTDLVRNRRARRPITVFDVGTLDQPTIEKVTKNEGPIPLPAGTLAGGTDSFMKTISPGTEPRDNYSAQDRIEQDYEQALGMSANQQGTFAKSKRTATEVRAVQGNSSARAETETDRTREYFIALVRKYDAILQRFATAQELQKVLGAQGAQLWEQWRVLPGKFAYDVLPDSGVHVDAAQYRAQILDEYNLLRKDDRVNTDELLKKVGRALGYDPATFVVPAPDKTTEPPSFSVAFSGDDTQNPAMGNLLLDAAANGGMKLRPETIAAFKEQHDLAKAQQLITGLPTTGPAIGADSDPNAHGGSANVTEPVNQHQTERTGGVQGMGVM